ncbi:MAG TPA: nitroreductase [candidate division Zixibacteria bacterium]|nr:nitroreductase [candidate division Zixibacteria bacterium]
MQVKRAIHVRRAFRALDKIDIPDETIHDLVLCAGLAPSCFNKQPWRFVFARGEKLDELTTALSKGNEWAQNASLIAGVYSAKELDCVVAGREYYLFGCGLAVGQMLLRATELGLVAHPIAGFGEKSAKEILGIPPEMTLITLLIIGKRTGEIPDLLSPKQIEEERERPPRMAFDEFARIIG